MIKRFLYIFLISGFVFGGLFGWKFYQMQLSASNAPVPPPAVVAITQVKQVEWGDEINALGSLVATEGVLVNNELAGNVSAIYFKSGQSIRKGELLLELDSSIDQAELNGLKAERRLAEIRFQRDKKLLKGNYVATSDYDQSKALLEAAIAAVDAKQALLDKKKIRAPFAGDLGIRQVDLGQYLQPGSNIVSLQRLNPLYVDFTVQEKELARISEGMQVWVSVAAYPEQRFSGKVQALESSIAQSSRSIKIRAEISNDEKKLRPGMFAQVEVVSAGKQTALILPDTAINYNPYGNAVFVVESGEQGLTVQNRQVTTGESRDGYVQILQGLAVGEKVVSAGQVKLRNGMAVIADKQAAPGERSPL